MLMFCRHILQADIMIETLRCQSCGAPLAHNETIGADVLLVCRYCGSKSRMPLNTPRETAAVAAASSARSPFSLEQLNAPAERPASTRIRLVNEPGVRFYACLKGTPDAFTSVFSFSISLFFSALPVYFESQLIQSGMLLPAAALMWGISFSFLFLMLFNARRAGLRSWPLRRIFRTLLHLALPNAALFFMQLGLFRLFDREELIAERGRITLRRRNLFGWSISRNISDVTGAAFRNENSQPLFSVTFTDAVWTLGLDMSIPERRWVRTELARFLGIIPS